MVRTLKIIKSIFRIFILYHAINKFYINTLFSFKRSADYQYFNFMFDKENCIFMIILTFQICCLILLCLTNINQKPLLLCFTKYQGRKWFELINCKLTVLHILSFAVRSSVSKVKSYSFFCTM